MHNYDEKNRLQVAFKYYLPRLPFEVDGVEMRVNIQFFRR